MVKAKREYYRKQLKYNNIEAYENYEMIKKKIKKIVQKA